MKQTLSIHLFPFLFLIVIPIVSPDRVSWQPASPNENASMGCGPLSSKGTDTLANGKFVIALPGWGDYSYRISTDNDSTQYYFNQGLNMYYSYHMREARASFREASRFDPDCAMAYWGEALSMGPTYNSAHLYKESEEVHSVIQRMNQTAKTASAREQSLARVMNSRYSPNNSASQRGALNQAYATGLRQLMGLYPDDADITTLYIDAAMLMHPWNFWDNDGSPKSWTPELVALCESILKKHPHHPAALHYYIHLTEASRAPEVALASADALKDLLPGVAHMVHMSSHEYERNGLYAKAVHVNTQADNDLMHYDSIAKNLELSRHVPHYFAVRAYCALSAGMYTKGMPAAIDCRNSVSPKSDDNYSQYLYMFPALSLVRLGKWTEILQNNVEPDDSWPYAVLLHHFTKGLAFLHTGRTDSAAYSLRRLRSLMKGPVLKLRRIPFNTPLQSAAIAEKILAASIDFSNKKYKRCLASLRDAARMEDALIYTEPKDWMIPARQFLGAYLLKLNRPAEAEKVYRDDLVWNPGSGWSLLGIYQSLQAQGRPGELEAYRTRYLAAFSEADEIPPASVYLGHTD